MNHFFSQTEALPERDSLLTAKSYFSDQKASGLIEKPIDATRTAILVLGGGLPCTAYTLENGISNAISLTEFSSLNNGVGSFRAIKLPDVAGRLTWLALESQKKDNFSIDNDDDWKKQLDQWKQDRFCGLVEIISTTVHGFAFFWQGEIQKSEIIFSTPQGFISESPQMESSADSLWEVTTYVHPPSTQAYRCAMLRHGAVDWGHHILSRYREMVGQKLLQLMDRELNRQIQPWQWNIQLEGNVMADSHFFASLNDATHAYRSLFMAMGVQMNFVIGNMLTQRLLNETFALIHPDERAILQSERLIPAAFSE